MEFIGTYLSDSPSPAKTPVTPTEEQINTTTANLILSQNNDIQNHNKESFVDPTTFPRQGLPSAQELRKGSELNQKQLVPDDLSIDVIDRQDLVLLTANTTVYVFSQAQGKDQQKEASESSKSSKKPTSQEYELRKFYKTQEFQMLLANFQTVQSTSVDELKRNLNERAVGHFLIVLFHFTRRLNIGQENSQQVLKVLLDNIGNLYTVIRSLFNKTKLKKTEINACIALCKNSCVDSSYFGEKWEGKLMIVPLESLAENSHLAERMNETLSNPTGNKESSQSVPLTKIETLVHRNPVHVTRIQAQLLSQIVDEMHIDLLKESLCVNSNQQADVDPEKMFGEEQYRSGDKFRRQLNLISQVITDAFGKHVKGYEEFCNGLMQLVDLEDEAEGIKTDTLEDLVEAHLSTDDGIISWRSQLRIKISMLLTFFLLPYSFGCERYYLKWSCMIHTINVMVYKAQDLMLRPSPPRFKNPFFQQSCFDSFKIDQSTITAELTSQMKLQIEGRKILSTFYGTSCLKEVQDYSEDQLIQFWATFTRTEIVSGITDNQLRCVQISPTHQQLESTVSRGIKGPKLLLDFIIENNQNTEVAQFSLVADSYAPFKLNLLQVSIGRCPELFQDEVAKEELKVYIAMMIQIDKDQNQTPLIEQNARDFENLMEGFSQVQKLIFNKATNFISRNIEQNVKVIDQKAELLSEIDRLDKVSLTHLDVKLQLEFMNARANLVATLNINLPQIPFYLDIMLRRVILRIFVDNWMDQSNFSQVIQLDLSCNSGVTFPASSCKKPIYSPLGLLAPLLQQSVVKQQVKSPYSDQDKVSPADKQVVIQYVEQVYKQEKLKQDMKKGTPDKFTADDDTVYLSLETCMGQNFEARRWSDNYGKLHTEWLHDHIVGARLQLFAIDCISLAKKRQKAEKKAVTFAKQFQLTAMNRYLKAHSLGLEDLQSLSEKAWY